MSFWELQEKVQQFAQRDPDHRLLELVEEYTIPRQIRVLDLGCAGGRNTVFLAKKWFDIYAIDGSLAMIEETRNRVAKIIGNEASGNRIHHGLMTDLSRYDSASFDLMVALGIFQNATTADEWHKALTEASRVLKIHGRMLVADFHSDSSPEGKPLVHDTSEAHVYHGFGPNPMYLLNEKEHDHEFQKFGLIPDQPTQTVRASTENGYRMTINSLYIKIK